MIKKFLTHLDSFLQGFNLENGAFDLCGDEIIFEGDSPYHHITIKDEPNGLRTMYFGPCAEEAETSINLHKPDESVFEYPAMMLVSLALHLGGRKVLMLGLGGGYLPSVFKKHLPDYELTVVEIDPLVSELAETYFGFCPGANVKVVIEDGLEYLLRQADSSFDFIWLDAFSGSYVPSHLSGCDFLSLCRRCLTTKGVLVQNLHQNNPALFGRQLNETSSVFDGGYIGLDGERCGNAVIMSSKDAFSDFSSWKGRDLIAAVKKFGGRIGSHDLNREAKKFKCFKPGLLIK